MRRVAVLMALPLSVVSAAGASGAVDRSLVAPAMVTGLAVDGRYVAHALARRSGDCFHVRIWNRTTGRVVRLGRARPCGPASSTGQGLVGPVVAGARSLWLTYVGGNLREWSLWTASTQRRTPRLLATEIEDVELPSPFVLGAGDAGRFISLLPFAVRRTVIALAPDGSRAFEWQAPAPISALAVSDGEVAAAATTGIVYILDADGRVRRTERFERPVLEIRITRSGIVAQRGLRLIEYLGGLSRRVFTMAPGGRLSDAYGTLAVYVAGRAVHLLRLDTGRDRVVRRTRRLAVAQLDGRTLVVAEGRRISSTTIRP